MAYKCPCGLWHSSFGTVVAHREQIERQRQEKTAKPRRERIVFFDRTGSFFRSLKKQS